MLLFFLLHLAQVISCVDEMFGCGGGTTTSAYKYLMDSTTAGLANSWFYPYMQGVVPSDLCLSSECTKTCKPLTHMVTETTFAGSYAQVANFSFATKPCFRECDHQDLHELEANLRKRGPASICVNAGEWDNYVGGVMSASACGNYSFAFLDHCVHLVGFNAEHETPYWIVRNSWDTTWGEDGYVYLEMSENTCGVADVPQFADVGPPKSGFRYHNNTRNATASGQHR